MPAKQNTAKKRATSKKATARKKGPKGGTHGRPTKAEAAAKNTVLAESPELQQAVVDLVAQRMTEFEKQIGTPEVADWKEAQTKTAVQHQLVTTYAKAMEAAALGAQFVPKAAVIAHWQDVNERTQIALNSAPTIGAKVEGLTVDQRAQLNKAIKEWLREVQGTFASSEIR